MSAPELWARLSAEGLVEGDLPGPHRPSSPWYVRAMLGIAGWIGAIFLLIFVGIGFSFIANDAASAVIAGAACCASAYGLFRRFEDQDFVEQFALALSLAGQALMIVGFAQFFRMEGQVFYFVVAASQLILALAVPNFLHRVLAAGGAAAALAMAIAQLSLHGLATPLLCAGLALVWLEPRRWAADARIWRPVGYGVALALLLVETFRLFGVEHWFDGSNDAPGWMELHGPLLGRALAALVLAAVAASLSIRGGHQAGSRIFLIAVGAALLVGVIGLDAPGLAAALIVLIVGFAAGNRILIGVGVVSLLGFVSHFYYSLHATLLEKSGLLALTGLALLGAYALLRRRAADAGAAADA